MKLLHDVLTENLRCQQQLLFSELIHKLRNITKRSKTLKHNDNMSDAKHYNIIKYKIIQISYL